MTNQISQQELNRLLEIEKKHQKVTERSKYYTKRRNVKIKILLRKCQEMNIVVTDEEIDKEMNKS